LVVDLAGVVEVGEEMVVEEIVAEEIVVEEVDSEEVVEGTWVAEGVSPQGHSGLQASTVRDNMMMMKKKAILFLSQITRKCGRPPTKF
jgi:hypothetical protein